MNKSAPTLSRTIAMVVFAMSCLGLILFLWIQFGGALPFKPKGYRFEALFPEATTLTKEADVRISGVPVGKVKEVVPDLGSGRARATIEMKAKYAPVTVDSRAVLRQKTLLGETYVELTPGTKTALEEGGSLGVAQISPTVQLDEIFRAFDPPTRRAFQQWLQNQALAVDGRGQAINDALGNLGPLADEAQPLVDTLNRQDAALQQVVRDTGKVFAALTRRDTELRQLIHNSHKTFRATGRRDRELRDAIQALPEFERQSKLTVERLAKFAKQTDPLITQLRPAARELSPTLKELGATAPDLKELLRALDGLEVASKKGFPAAEKILDDLRPLLAQIDPSLRQLNPMLDFIGHYKPEVAAFLANTVAATQATAPAPGFKQPLHYLRTTNPLNPENLAAYATRVGSNRSNPYVVPGGLGKLGSGGLDVFEDRNCGRPMPHTILDSTPPTLGPELLERVKQNAFRKGPDGMVAAPPCRLQSPFSFGGGQTQYPHVNAR